MKAPPYARRRPTYAKYRSIFFEEECKAGRSFPDVAISTMFEE